MARGFIPNELIQQQRWVSWRLIERNGKPSKVPFVACSDKMAKSDDPATWSDIPMTGNIGFMLLGQNYCVIDLDHCLETEFAKRVLELFKGTWIEFSPSGDGVHIWIIAKKPGTKSRNSQIEIYDGSVGRYITVTGNRHPLSGDAVLPMQEQLNKLYAEMFPEKPSNIPCRVTYSGYATVDRIIEKILAGKHAGLFQGNMSEYNEDHSRADQALMNVIAYYCEGNRSLADAVFRASALMRPKWNRDDYRNNTINRAFNDLNESFDWSANDITVDFSSLEQGEKEKNDALGYPHWMKLSTSSYTIGEKIMDDAGHTVCPHQIYISARVVDVDSQAEYVKVKYKRGKNWREEIIKASVIGDKTKIKALADIGVMVDDTNAKYLVPYLSHLRIVYDQNIPIEQATSKLGWHEEEFVPFCKSYTPNIPDAQIIPAMVPKGDYYKWKECVIPEFKEHPEVRLAVGTVIASVLVKDLGINCFVTQLWGESGCGKTVSQMMAASVWGHPSRGFAISANGTDNALIQRCAILYNLPLVIDELETLRAGMRKTEFNGLIYTLTEGTDRARLDSNAQSREIRNWQNATLTNGEAPMTDGSNAQGALNRVIEINFPDVIFEKSKGNEIARTVSKNYGWFGRDVIDYWRLAKDKWYKKFEDYTSYFMANTVTTKQAQAGAAVAVGAAIAGEMFDVKCEPEKDILQHLKKNADVDVALRAKDYIIGMFAKYQGNFIDGNDDAVYRSQIWGKADTKHEEVFWIKENLEEVLHEGGFSFNAVKKGWVFIKFLEKTGDRYTEQVRLNKAKAYCAKLIIKSEDKN